MVTVERNYKAMKDSTKRCEEVAATNRSRYEIASGGGNDSAVDKGLDSDKQVVTELEPILCLDEWRRLHF